MKSTVRDPERTTALGLVTDASNMLAAAQVLQRNGDDKLSHPMYYLIGHGIEVALKSFLLYSGIDLEVLRKKYNHDLLKLSKKVESLADERLSIFVSDYLAAIDMLNIYYMDKQFEYRVTGFKRYPDPNLLITFLEKFILIVHPLIVSHYLSRSAAK
jgi:hypothetical protein